MTARRQRCLGRWSGAGLIDPASADRIRACVASPGKTLKFRWPILLAIGLDGLLLCAGVPLFVAAHRDTLSPASRFALGRNVYAAGVALEPHSMPGSIEKSRHLED